MKKIEALADAIAYYCAAHDPTSIAFRNRNPGLLMAISPKHSRDEHGYRVFASFVDGYRALLFDLQVKCSGRSNAKLTPESTLTDLLNAMKHRKGMADSVASYLRKALEDESISAETPLAYFLES